MLCWGIIMFLSSKVRQKKIPESYSPPEKPQNKSLPFLLFLRARKIAARDLRKVSVESHL